MLVSWIFPQHTREILKQNASRCVNPFFKGVVPSSWLRFRNLKWELSDADSSITWLELSLDFQACLAQLMKLVPETMLKGLRKFSHQLLVGWRRFVAPLLLYGLGTRKRAARLPCHHLVFLA